MVDELEDLESMRLRIREEGRIRREYELKRRRKKAASRRRRRLREELGGGGGEDDSSSSSSSSSADLLASSPSPSPSPIPPPELDDLDEVDNATSANNNSLSITTTGGSITRNQSSSSSPAAATATARKNSSIDSKHKSTFDIDSDDSDSDINMAEVAKRIVKRKTDGSSSNYRNNSTLRSTDLNKFSNNSSKIGTNNNREVTNLRIPWSDDSSEDDTDKLVTTASREKRKSDSHEAIPSVHLDRKVSGHPQHQQKQESETSTQPISSTVNADSRANSEVNISTSSENGLKGTFDVPIPSSEYPKILEEINAPSPDALESSTKPTTSKANASSPDASEKSTKSEATSASNASTSDAVEASHAMQQTIYSEPIIGKDVRHKPNITWTTHKQCLLIRSVVSSQPPRDKVAGFDLDQTLVNWRCAGWPSKSEHYELWNSTVIDKLRKLHDKEGYSLIIFSNQGGIKNALGGKKAGTVMGIIDWIAEIIDRPLFAIVSTKINSGYHKPSPSMWEVFEDICNYGKEASPKSSFFVGDTDGSGDAMANPQQQQHQQTGTDKLFAEKVGEMRNTTMKFYTPGEYFGPSNVDQRRSSSATVVDAPPPLPSEAVRARAALLGGYLSGPICLVLVGVQGSGKSTFCQSLVDANGGNTWAQFSQDTINNGRPGTRQAVEEAAQDAIRSGKNVVIDRMHLDEEQRQHFIQLGRQCKVPVHCLVIMATKEEVEDRVRHRVNHPGKVEGDHGARIAVASLSRLILPKYDEGFELISFLWHMEDHLLLCYRLVGEPSALPLVKSIELYNAGKFSLPLITLGTMNVKKPLSGSLVTQAMQLGVTSVDTAPTYGNEKEVGGALKEYPNAIVTIKIPKRATTAEQARNEVMQSLSVMQRSRVDIILLHWPCDFIETGTLTAVWKELEAMKKDGFCSAIGVCNFTTSALKILLSDCTIKPALNQVERHPVLPQYDLLDFCNSQGITVQAHTALGHGNELLMGNSTIVRIARENEMSPAQGE